VGEVGRRALDGMRHAVAALAARGNSLIVDDVMLEGEADIYRRLLAGCDLRLVGLHAPLEVLEARERARGDREIGLARGQAGRVHRGVVYDLEVDTSQATPDEIAARICAACGV
jgi:chloramphenicol 3-O phosphotransferase